MGEIIKCSRCGKEFERGETGSKKGICSICIREISRIRYRELHPKKEKKVEKNIICSKCGALFERGSVGSEGNRCPSCIRESNRKRYSKSIKNPPNKYVRFCSVCGVMFTNGEKGSLRGKCPSCRKAYKDQYFSLNHELVLERNRKDYFKNIDKRKEYKKEYTAKNIDKIREKRKEYYEANKDELQIKKNIHKVERLHSDIWFKMRESLSGYMRNTLKRFGSKKNKEYSQLLGCTIEEFGKYIESLFTDGMTWDNYGNNGWVLDHIIPCASFDLSKEEEQMKCFNYTNLQPLWFHDNSVKSDKMPDGTLGRNKRK